MESKQSNVEPGTPGVGAQEKEKKVYSPPTLVVFGTVGELTQKVKGIQDQNQSNSNNMGWSS